LKHKTQIIQSLFWNLWSVPIGFSIVSKQIGVDLTSFRARFEKKKRKKDFTLVAWVIVKVDYFSEENEFGEKLSVVL
jgi:hypothetical protein